MTEIDWHRIHFVRLAACCQRAAADLNLSVTSPFKLNEGTDDECVFAALFPHLGTHQGIVVCLSSDWEPLSEKALAAGYTCVGVTPDKCDSYDPRYWESCIAEWDSDAPPPLS